MLDKAIKHGKEKRKHYRGSKRFDRSCRNHGSCSYCEDNRLFKRRKAETEAFNDIEDWLTCAHCNADEDECRYCNELGMTG